MSLSGVAFPCNGCAPRREGTFRRPLPFRACPAQQRHRVFLAGQTGHLGEPGEGLGDLQMVPAAEPLADRGSLGEQGVGLVVQPELGVDAAQGAKELRPQERLVLEILAETLGATAQELPGVGERAAGLPRVRRFEDLLEKPRRGAGPRGLLLGLIASRQSDLPLRSQVEDVAGAAEVGRASGARDLSRRINAARSGSRIPSTGKVSPSAALTSSKDPDSPAS